MTKPLQVMKFGGTSVGDATCIARSAQIVAAAAKEMRIVVVVSAMSGVTNRLIDAAKRSEQGDTQAGTTLVDALRQQHHVTLAELVSDEADRSAVQHKLEEVLAEGKRLYDGTAMLHELTPRTLDVISGLGERLCAPMFAGALRQLGTKSIPVEAT